MSSCNERKRQVESEKPEGRRLRTYVVRFSPEVVTSASVVSEEDYCVGEPQNHIPEQVEEKSDLPEKITEKESTPEKSIGALVQSLFLTDKETVISTFHTLLETKLQQNSTNKRQDFVGAGGCLAVVHAMKNHFRSRQVQLHGLRVLKRLVNKSDENKASIAEINGVQVVLNAMTRFAKHEFLQERAGLVLRHLSTGAVSRNKILEYHKGNAVKLVIASMQTFPSNTGIQLDGCFFLRQLAKHSDDAKEVIRNNHGVATVAKSFELLPENVRKRARRAMMTLM